jgi:hypothetical protein
MIRYPLPLLQNTNGLDGLVSLVANCDQISLSNMVILRKRYPPISVATEGYEITLVLRLVG